MFTFLRFAGIPYRYASERGGWALIFLWLIWSCLIMGTHSCKQYSSSSPHSQQDSISQVSWLRC